MFKYITKHSYLNLGEMKISHFHIKKRGKYVHGCLITLIRRQILLCSFYNSRYFIFFMMDDFIQLNYLKTFR
jgi:hypothetical protein